jgi:hypothetical protein
LLLLFSELFIFSVVRSYRSLGEVVLVSKLFATSYEALFIHHIGVKTWIIIVDIFLCAVLVGGVVRLALVDETLGDLAFTGENKSGFVSNERRSIPLFSLYSRLFQVTFSFHLTFRVLDILRGGTINNIQI